LPCLKAFLLAFGAPGDRPPCIRQRPFGIAGDWHGLPLLVRAVGLTHPIPQRTRTAIARPSVSHCGPIYRACSGASGPPGIR
jgi:hypothetical protein